MCDARRPRPRRPPPRRRTGRPGGDGRRRPPGVRRRPLRGLPRRMGAGGRAEPRSPLRGPLGPDGAGGLGHGPRPARGGGDAAAGLVGPLPRRPGRRRRRPVRRGPVRRDRRPAAGPAAAEPFGVRERPPRPAEDAAPGRRRAAAGGRGGARVRPRRQRAAEFAGADVADARSRRRRPPRRRRHRPGAATVPRAAAGGRHPALHDHEGPGDRRRGGRGAGRAAPPTQHRPDAVGLQRLRRPRSGDVPGEAAGAGRRPSPPPAAGSWKSRSA